MAQIHLVHDPWPEMEATTKTTTTTGNWASRCLHWHIFYFCFTWEIFSAEFMGSLRFPLRLIPVHMSPRIRGLVHSICFCFNSYKIFYANLAVYCLSALANSVKCNKFSTPCACVRLRVPVSWEIIQQFSHLLFGSAGQVFLFSNNFPLIYCPSCGPPAIFIWLQMCGSFLVVLRFLVLFFFCFQRVKPFSYLQFTGFGNDIYYQVHRKFASSSLTKFGSHAGESNVYVYIFPLLISESVWNWFNMQIEFCQLNL